MIFLHNFKAFVASKMTYNAKLWHKLWSIRLMIATAFYTAAAGAWVLLPEEFKPDIGHVGKAILAGIGVLLPGTAAVSVVIKQNLPPDPSSVKAADPEPIVVAAIVAENPDAHS